MKKKLCTLLMAFAAVAMLLTACKKETNEYENSPLIGTWVSNNNSYMSQTSTNINTGEVTDNRYPIHGGWKVTFNADGTSSEGPWKMEGSKLTLQLPSETKVFDVVKVNDKSLIIEQKTEEEVGNNHTVIISHYELDKQ